MPDRGSLNQFIVSHVFVWAGMVMVGLPLYFAAFNPQIPLWLALLVGVGVGGSLLAFGLMKTSQSENYAEHVQSLNGDDAAVTSSSVDAISLFWLFVATAIYLFAIALSFLILLPLKWLSVGEGWQVVLARLTIIVGFAIAIRFWIQHAKQFVYWLFRNKLPYGFLDQSQTRVTQDRNHPALPFAENATLAILAFVAFLLASGAFDSQFPWFASLNSEIDRMVKDANRNTNPNRYRWLAHLLDWCRNHPNTMRSLAFMIGSWASGIILYRIVFRRTKHA